MSRQEGLWSRLLARITGKLPGEWQGEPGGNLHEAVDRVTEFSKKHNISLDKATEILMSKATAWGKTDGLINEKTYAETVEKWKQVEERDISIERLRRNSDNLDRVETARAIQEEEIARKHRLDADGSELENALKRWQIREAELAYFEKLRELGLTLVKTETGDVVVCRAPGDLDYRALITDSDSYQMVESLDDLES